MKRPSEISLAEWKQLYPAKTLAQISLLLNCSESTVHKWIKKAGVTLTKQPRQERTQKHKDALSNALKGRNTPKSGGTLTCANCGGNFYVIAARLGLAKYCSVKCRAAKVQATWTGAKNPRFISDVLRQKTCEGCGNDMIHMPPKPITSFLLQKYCSRDCADRHGDRLRGENHPGFKGTNARKRSRNHQDSRWASRVLQRDGYTCKRCEVTGVKATLQAHHIKPYELFPDQRGEVDNGVTLCSKCHWEVHDTMDPLFIFIDRAADKKTKRNSKELILKGTLVEGKTFGKDSRKWTGNCYWCGIFLVKRLSDVTNRKSTFCGKSCAMKHRRAFGSFRPTATDLIPETAKPPEASQLNTSSM